MSHSGANGVYWSVLLLCGNFWYGTFIKQLKTTDLDTSEMIPPHCEVTF